MDAQTENEEIQFRRRKRIAVAIMLSSILGVFVVGFYFDLFGKKIDFINVPANYLFFGFILLGIFGVLYTFLRKQAALIGTILMTGVYWLIFLLGKLSRVEL
jgi:uncharacterized membrane protein